MDSRAEHNVNRVTVKAVNSNNCLRWDESALGRKRPWGSQLRRPEITGTCQTA